MIIIIILIEPLLIGIFIAPCICQTITCALHYMYINEKTKHHGKCHLKKCVFNTFLNVDIDDIVLICRGSEFHKLGAFTENALSP